MAPDLPPRPPSAPPPPPPPPAPSLGSPGTSLAGAPPAGDLPQGRTGSPVGALWVAGLGAFLLVAAAATFVAVRWDDIPAGAKLAALVAVTLTCLQAHLRLREPLPVTATVLLHLGVLLVPVDVAALGVRFGWDWPAMLLAQGLAAVVVFGAAARAERSVVLQAGTWLGVVLLAGGIGGSTDVPAGLVLAGVALATVAARASLGRAGAADLWAAGWALLAGLAMPLAATEALGIPGAGVLDDLGLTGDGDAAAAGLTGVLAGVVLGIVGGRRRSLPAALTGIGCVLAGAVTAWMDLGPDGSRPHQIDVASSLTAMATLALLAELAAWSCRSDPFWYRPTGIVAGLGEVAAGVVTLGYAVAGLTAPVPDPSPQAALAAALVSLTWLAALASRQPVPRGARPPGGAAGAPPPRTGPVTAAATAVVTTCGPAASVVAACAAVALATGSQVATAWALNVGASAAVLVSPRRFRDARAAGAGLAVCLLAWAPVLAGQGNEAMDGHPLLVAALGLAGALAIAAAAVTATRADPDDERTPPAGLLLALLAPAPLVVATSLVAAAGEEAAAATLGIVGTWLVAAVLDLSGAGQAGDGRRAGTADARAGWPGPPDPRAATTSTVTLGDVVSGVRAAALVPLVLTLWLAPGPMAAVAGVGAALALLDAVRRDQPWLLLGAAVGVPIAAAGLALDQGADLPRAGLVVTLIGVAWLAVAAALPRRWAEPAGAAAGLAGVAGLVLCIGDQGTMATYLLVAGATLAAAGVALVEHAVVGTGAAVATLGLWSHLSLAGVTASEPYVAPAALLALAAGITARHHRRTTAAPPGSPQSPRQAQLPGQAGSRREAVSSWVAYAPSVALLGGTALAERLAGGPAWHALVAGAVGTLAVAAGGLERLAGPLLVGTGLVVAVTVHETLGVTARFPTWVWLAGAGALLLAAGIAMERRATGPVETGKRLVDLVREQFS